jgi:hypothetical protein
MSDIGTVPDCEAPPVEAPWTAQAGAAEAIAESMVLAVHELARFLRQAQEPVLPRLPLGLRTSVAIGTACLGWAVKRLAYPVLFAICDCHKDGPA